MKDGYILTHRSTFEHPIVGEHRPLHCLLWIRMVSLAYFKTKGDIQRGQFKATYRQLADRYGIPLSSFRDFKNELVGAGMLAVETGSTLRQPSTTTH